jgi:hypothetical protein
MMVRLRAVVAVLLVTVGLLAGCTPEVPSSLDGNLVDEWSDPLPVKGYTPVAGPCYPAAYPFPHAGDTKVDCAEKHVTQTLYVGQFTTETEPTAKEMAAAYADCNEQVNRVLRRSWMDGLVKLYVAVPTTYGWAGGARFYRCDLIHVGADGMLRNIERAGDLMAGFPAGSLFGCATAKDTADNTIDVGAEVPCSQRHNVEYAGSVMMPPGMAYPKTDSQWDPVHRQCDAKRAAFLGVSVSNVRRYGSFAWSTTSEFWDAGQHGMRCFLYFGSKSMVGSAKGTGGKGVPTY